MFPSYSSDSLSVYHPLETSTIMSDTSESTLCSEPTTQRSISDIAEHLEFFLRIADEDSRISNNDSSDQPRFATHWSFFLEIYL